jgi:uncharacterized membrane protein YbhN (UPF0104 family)
MRARIAAWVAVALVVAAGAAVVDWSAVSTAARTVARDPFPLALALAAYTLAFVLRAVAWGPLLPVSVPLGRRVRALFAMLAVNHALPGPVGELARARVVSGPDLPIRRAVLSVVAARVVDVGAVALLLLVGAWAAGEVPAWARVGAPLGVGLPLVALAVARRRGATLTSRDAARVAALAIPSWALECGVLWAVARAAGFDLSLPAALLATCTGVLAQVAAVLPGGIGTYEAGVTSALVVLGLPVAPALAVAASTHMVKFAYAFAVGIPALLVRPPDFGAMRGAWRPASHKSRLGLEVVP